jgi:hypothetical protein
MDGTEIMLDSALHKNHGVGAPVEETQICKTSLAQSVTSGSTTLEVEDSSGCDAGDVLQINGDKERPHITLVDGNQVHVEPPLRRGHEAKAPVIEVKVCKSVLAQSSQAGDSRIKVVDSTGCAVGDMISVDTSEVQDNGTRSSLLDNGTSSSHLAPLLSRTQGQDVVSVSRKEIKPVLSIQANVIVLGEPLRSPHQKGVPVADAKICKTELAKPHNVNETRVVVIDPSGCKVGDRLHLDKGSDDQEVVEATSIEGHQIVLTKPLTKKHMDKAPVAEAQVCRAVLAVASREGESKVIVTSVIGCDAGDWVLIDGGQKNHEQREIQSVKGKKILRLVNSLEKRHKAKATVEEMNEQFDSLGQSNTGGLLPEKQFDCNETEKKEWCCTNKEKLCVKDDLYDCAPNWSEKKSEWCCRNQQIGCDA